MPSSSTTRDALARKSGRSISLRTTTTSGQGTIADGEAKDRFLIDTAFMIERTHKTFFETPLLTIDGKDHTCTFGFVRDFLRMRRRLGITHSASVICKHSHTLLSEQQFHDVIVFLQRFAPAHLHDPFDS